ncbi:UDP-glucose/GDP-mannose dehydrogenase family protein [Patescibacteria group bacterium]|nr:UDP-glucose/GDP-mannose dehydrogenase family protein [Patescibacteria group bacterium]
MKKPKIGIIGIGIVGESLKRYFELNDFKRGRNLFCHDTDSKKKYTDDVSKADIIFICVPSLRNPDGTCNTKIVEGVVKKYASPDRIMVIKSTVEPSTCERLAKKYQCSILFNPEFLTETRAWEDMVNPDRQIVAHTLDNKMHASQVLSMLPMAFFSSPGTLGTYDFIRVNATEAELGKYAGNTFGALKVTFGNIFADICRGLEKVMKKEGLETSIDYNNVRGILAHDRRIGDAWLDVYHGKYRGFAGYCFPKDVDALIAVIHSTIKKLPQTSVDVELLSKGVKMLEAMCDYNKTLLESQGLDVQSMNIHDKEVETRLANRQERKKI